MQNNIILQLFFKISKTSYQAYSLNPNSQGKLYIKNQIYMKIVNKTHIIVTNKSIRTSSSTFIVYNKKYISLKLPFHLCYQIYRSKSCILSKKANQVEISSEIKIKETDASKDGPAIMFQYKIHLKPILKPTMIPKFILVCH